MTPGQPALPRRPPRSASAGGSLVAVAKAEDPGRPRRVVLVEDEDLFCDLLRASLQLEDDLEVVGLFVRHTQRACGPPCTCRLGEAHVRQVSF